MMDGNRWKAMDRRNDRQPASWRKARPSLAAVICACCFLGIAFHAATLRAQGTSSATNTTAGDFDAQRISPDTVLHCPAGTAEFRDQTFQLHGVRRLATLSNLSAVELRRRFHSLSRHLLPAWPQRSLHTGGLRSRRGHSTENLPLRRDPRCDCGRSGRIHRPRLHPDFMAAIHMTFAGPAAISISENIFWSRSPRLTRTIARSLRAAIVPHPG